MSGRSGLLFCTLLLGCSQNLVGNQFACETALDCLEGYRCALPDLVCLKGEGCGDGVLQAQEGCDDGNPSVSGGCDACQIRHGWTCEGAIGQASVCLENAPRALAVGAQHWCVADVDGVVTCNGSDFEGPPSDGRRAGQTQVPSDLPPVTALVAGSHHTCAILESSRNVRCWGSNTGWGFINNQPFEVDARQSIVPSDLGQVRSIGATAYATCAVRQDESLRCWGMEYQDMPSSGDFTMVSVGSGHACALLSNGTPKCWGDDQKQGVKLNVPLYTSPYTDLGVGLFHSCGVRSNGMVVCWGLDNDTERIHGPEGRFKEVEAGHYHSCALTDESGIVCWGIPLPSNSYGQSDPPTGRFLLFAIGNMGGCGVRSDGEIDCWGKVEVEP